ncbi:hypothetical protein RHGRI_001023 [Rhododendron griersonianum]|uniref:Uncharacterized protein n=1 Tax=Rhododendron griersonianum TaxID=479676 RepID=A0AAV6LJM2_9ERIC|nr:hypothetical protein RHGRI_001023 [Rhododendron griersonianum]
MNISIIILTDFITQVPYLGNTRTHLQRELRDDNVLIVKFAVEASNCTNKMIGSSYYDVVFNKIAEEGILIGLRSYQFFGDFPFHALMFKDSSLLPLSRRENRTFWRTNQSVKRGLISCIQTWFSLILFATIKLQNDLLP